MSQKIPRCIAFCYRQMLTAKVPLNYFLENTGIQ